VVQLDWPGLGESPADINNLIFLTVSFILYWIHKFLAVQRQKLLNLLKAFQNRCVQIFCSYWMTDVSEWHQKLVKTGERFSFEKLAAQRSPLLKAGQWQLAGLGKLLANSKAFCAKRPGTY
jgi:hypothetical protein